MDCNHKVFNKRYKLVNWNKCLFTGITADNHALVLFNILRTDFNSYRHALHFILGKLPSGSVVWRIEFYSELFGKCLSKLLCLFKNTLFVLCNRNECNLNRGNLRRKNKTVIIRVNHNERSDHSCRNTPWCLMRIMKLIVLACVCDAKALCKAVAEVVWCTALKSNTVVHHRLNCVGFFGTCELFFFCLSADYCRNGKSFLVEIRINM